MVLKDEKIFFYHVPKTGGTAIENYLFTQFEYGFPNYTTFTGGFISRDLPSSSEKWTITSLIHIPFLELAELAARSKINIDDSWNTFTIVRNPYNRISSAIFFQSVLRCSTNIHTLRTHKEKQFLFNKAQFEFFYDDNPHTWFGHACSQNDLLNFNDKFSVNVYKYEEGLEKVINNEFKNTLPKPSLKLKRENDNFLKSNIPKISYNTLWTYDFIKKINEKYEKDFERFGYKMLNPNDYPKF